MTKELSYDRYVIEDLPGAQRAQKMYTSVCSVDKLKVFQPIMKDDGLDSSPDEEETPIHPK